MATTNYAYYNIESLGDIANKFNTSVLNLVKLNNWLQDPNDGHTYMFPADAPEYIKPHFDGEGNIDYYELNPEVISPDCIRYKLLELVVPLTGNGNISIEDYWQNVNKITGISYNLLVDNIMNDTNMIATDLNPDYDTDDSNPEYDGTIIPTKANFINGSPIYGQLSGLTNAYMDNYVDGYKASSYSGSTFVDYASGLVGNYLQSQINAGAKNLSLYRNSALYRDLGSTYFNTGTNSNISGSYRDINDTYLNKFGGRKIASFRLLNNTYKSGQPRYGTIGNPNIIKGQCQVIVNGITLYMPCYPDSVSDTTAINYSSENTLGRSEPFYAYNNSGPRTISFSFRMHREMIGSESVNEIENIVKTIESAVYPNYDNSVSAVKVSVKIGNVIYISGIMTSQSTNWEGPIAADQKYNIVTVQFGITEVTGEPKSYNYVKEYGGFRK